MKKKYQYIILFVLFAIVIWYGYTHKELFLNLKKISALNIITLAILVIGHQITNGYRFKYLMKIFNKDISFKEWFGLSVCNTMFNYYLPARGGIVVRAYYLKKKYNFSFSHYTSLIAGSYIFSFLLASILGLILTLLYKPVHGVLPKELVGIFSGLLLLTVIGTVILMFFIKIGKRFKNNRINNIITLVANGLGYFKQNKSLIVIISFINLVGIFLLGARLFVVFYAIDVEVFPLQMLIIPSLTSFSVVLSLTPANLGIREGIISFSAYLFGLPADKAMIVALIDRGVAVLLTFLVGLIFSKILLPDMKENEII